MELTPAATVPKQKYRGAIPLQHKGTKAMDPRKEPSRNITLRGVVVWLARSGVASGVAVGIVYSLMQVGAVYRDVTLQREQLSAHEESQKADMLRIAERNAAQDEKRSADMLRIAERNAAQDEKLAKYLEQIAERNAAQDEKLEGYLEQIAKKNAAQDEKLEGYLEQIAKKNAAQDEKLAEHKKTQVRILAILEQQGRELKRLDEQNQKALTRLENKVDRMDDFLRNFLRDGKDSASLDEEASAQNASASLCIRHRKFKVENRAAL